MSREVMQQALDALYVAREFTELYGTEHAAWVNEKCHEAIAALRAALAEQAQPVAEMEKALADAQRSAAFYKKRCDALQKWQSWMRDPERMVVCDILANGFTLDPPVPADRYTTPPAPVAPPGWRMVPVEPTDAMVYAGKEQANKNAGGCRLARKAYRAMLDAAPKSP